MRFTLIRTPLLAGLVALSCVGAQAFSLDDRDEMKFSLRAYSGVRLATESKGGEEDPLSYPRSSAGHVQQHRYFLELKLDHDILRLASTGWGLARAFDWLQARTLKYVLHYRGEGEGIYTYGPHEWSHEREDLEAVRLDVPSIPPLVSPVLSQGYIRRRLRRLDRLGDQRHRLFLAYLDVEKGPLFVRLGRQILAWGETDRFRLLDNINPLDDSFGGFFIALDERRLPLDMLRASYQIGSVGPASDAFVEAFAAFGNRDATQPGAPLGSPWVPGGLGFPNPALRFTNEVPAKNATRGGARLVFNAADTTFTLAHYYTALDVPGVRFIIPQPENGLGGANFGREIIARQEFPRVPITGASLTTALPSLYSVLRAEAAYFQGEPMNRQGRGDSFDSFVTPGTPGYLRLVRQHNTEGGLDPFVYPRFLDGTRERRVVGSLLQRDSFNMAVGWDANPYVRWLNRAQTLLVTTQFFYKHVFDSPGDLVLPSPYRVIGVSPSIPIFGSLCGGGTRPCRLRPRLYHLDDDRFLHTLLITTSYYSGRLLPQIGVFYDWQGVVVLQPGLTFVHDPYRVLIGYTRVEGPPTGLFGAVRDRDNIHFQLEFVF